MMCLTVEKPAFRANYHLTDYFLGVHAFTHLIHAILTAAWYLAVRAGATLGARVGLCGALRGSRASAVAVPRLQGTARSAAALDSVARGGGDLPGL